MYVASSFQVKCRSSESSKKFSDIFIGKYRIQIKKIRQAFHENKTIFYEYNLQYGRRQTFWIVDSEDVELIWERGRGVEVGIVDDNVGNSSR